MKSSFKIIFNVKVPGFSIQGTGGFKDLNVKTSFCPLRELDSSGNSVHEESIESSNLKYESTYIETKNNITLTFSTTLTNGARFEVIQTVFLKRTKLRFGLDDVTIENDANAIKYSYKIEKWPFKNKNNRLEICTVQTSSKDTKCSVKEDTQVILFIYL